MLTPGSDRYNFCRADNERAAQNLVRTAQTLTRFLIYFNFWSQSRQKDFGYNEDGNPAEMQNEVLKATKKWFEIVQRLLPPTSYTSKSGTPVPYNFANTRSCRYFGDAMPALLVAGVKTNRENEDKGEQNQVTPKMLAQRFTMKGPQNARQVLQKAEESVRVGSQIPNIFDRGLRITDAAEAKQREKMKPRELRTKMLAVVAKSISEIMKEGTGPGFDVDSFVPSNTFASHEDLATEDEHMNNFEENHDEDGDAETGDGRGGEGNNDGNDDNDDDDDDNEGEGVMMELEEEEEEEQMQLEFTPLELQPEVQEEENDEGEDNQQR